MIQTTNQDPRPLSELSLDEAEMVGGGTLLPLPHWRSDFNLGQFVHALGHGAEQGAVSGAVHGAGAGPLGVLGGAVGGAIAGTGIAGDIYAIRHFKPLFG
jgi:hypothetical protein